MATARTWLALFLASAAQAQEFGVQGIHIGTGLAAGTMNVAWTTGSNESLADSVHWSKTGGALDLTAAGDSKPLNVSGSRYTHVATLEGLVEGAAYDYIVGEDGKKWTFTYRTEHVEGRPDRHIIFGDMGSSHAFTMCLACTASSLVCDAATCATNRTDAGLINEVGKADMFLHVGDFAYNFDTANGTVGDQFMRNIEQIAATTPYMVSHGNHEDSDDTCAHYLERFRHMPVNSEPPTYLAATGEVPNVLYYSWDAGLVHYVALSTELWFGVGPKDGKVSKKTMLAWLQKDLATVNRTKTPWVVCHGHRDIYCSTGLGDDGDCVDIGGIGPAGEVRKDLEPLFHEFGVDFWINGHEHSYERTYPLYRHKSVKSNVDAPSTVYIVTGAAGSQEMHEGFSKLAPSWSAFRSNTFGYSVLEAHNATHVHWQQIQTDPTLFPGSDYGRVIDDTWYVQHKHGPFDARRAPTGTAFPEGDEAPERSLDHWLPLLFPAEAGSGRASSALIREYRGAHGDVAWARKQDALLKWVNAQQGAEGRSMWEDVRGEGSSDGVWFTWKEQEALKTLLEEADELEQAAAAASHIAESR
jgi:hypothetical protein